MYIKQSQIILLFMCASSCVGPNYTVEGTYYYKDNPKTTLELKSDGKFKYLDLDFVEFCEFSNLKPMQTSGLWSWDSLENIYLQSLDTSLDQAPKILRKEINNIGQSVFTFFDLHRDTIFVNYRLHSDGTITSGVGKYRFPFWDAPLEPNDTIRLSCSHYPLWTYIAQDTFNYNYDVLLYPEYFPNHFRNDTFKVKRGRIVNARNIKMVKK